MTDESVLTMPVWQLYSWTVYANLAGIISILSCYRCDGTLSLDLSSVWLHWESYWFYLIYLAFYAFHSLFISIGLYVGQVICWLADASICDIVVVYPVSCLGCRVLNVWATYKRIYILWWDHWTVCRNWWNQWIPFHQSKLMWNRSRPSTDWDGSQIANADSVALGTRGDTLTYCPHRLYAVDWPYPNPRLRTTHTSLKPPTANKLPTTDPTGFDWKGGFGLPKWQLR